MDDEIFRQRHYLIAISTMLILFDFCDIKIAKVGVLGIELIVGSPDVLEEEGQIFLVRNKC